VTREAIRNGILHALGEIAPEADLGRLDGAAAIREELDLDSVDMLHFVAALDDQFHVAVPEVDYPKLATLDSCVEYLGGHGVAGS
jgi:acyl carrier protein